MHLFPEDIHGPAPDAVSPEHDVPFTDPFRYAPHPLVKAAAGIVMRTVCDSPVLSGLFEEGKMMGVLVVRDREGAIGFLAGFSGNVGGRSRIEGFVPPIYDLTDPEGHYRIREAEISAINADIRRLTADILDIKEHELTGMLQKRDEEISLLRQRKSSLDRNSPDYIRQSQFINAEIKRAKDRWAGFIAGTEKELAGIRGGIEDLKQRRAFMSDELQKWIFNQYIVLNAEGESASILEIFRQKGLVPPGGTGECAAPKLLNHAYAQGLTPVAMGEFWYGRSPLTAVRTHGHFYPSCTSKCGPLLSFMLKGLNISEHPTHTEAHPLSPGIIHEDELIIVAEKPSGMPSVPGLDGRESLQEWLSRRHGRSMEAVHRLDMDTSGIMVFARTEEAAINIRKQFEAHTVKKTYIARLCPADSHAYAAGIPQLREGDKGTIELPLSPDYDERPRQKVDMGQGKPSLTGYEVIAANDDGTTDILFFPHTGRTHQLRVHSAHISGLGRPILGDLLYGGNGTSALLHLHAHSITFTHPGTGEEVSFHTKKPAHSIL